MDTLVESLVAGLTSTVTSMMSAVGDIVPIALPVMGGIAVVGIGIGIFKKIAHK